MDESTAVELWSSIYISDEAVDTSTCSVEKSVWTTLMNRTAQEHTRLFGKIDFEDKTLYLALGSYVDCPSSDSDHMRLILPQWSLDVLSSTGMGDIGTVTWLSEEAFPLATRIVLRPHDSAFYHSDAKEELEVALTRIGVLQKGQTIVVNIQCLGDYPISFDVIDVEPANIVLAHGEEVIMEFEAALDQPPDPVPRPDTPVPDCSFASMLPEPVPLVPTIGVGRTTGGTNRYTADGRPWNPHRDA
jgi:hypothetical protein